MNLLEELQNRYEISKVDFPALISIIIGGIYYLALRSKSTEVFNGVNLKSNAGWKRIENGIRFLLDEIGDIAFQERTKKRRS